MQAEEDSPALSSRIGQELPAASRNTRNNSAAAATTIPGECALSICFIGILFYKLFLVSNRGGGNSNIGIHALKKGKTNRVCNKKSRGDRIGTTATMLGGLVLSLELRVVATLLFSFNWFRF